MLTYTYPNWPNKAKEEYEISFEKLDKGFSVLQNVKVWLKVTDGNNSQLDSVVLSKRDGSYSTLLTTLPKITSQFRYDDWDNNYHIITDWIIFKDWKDW